MACIQLVVATQGSVESSKTTAKWKAFTDEGKTITLVMGDIKLMSLLMLPIPC